MTRRLDEVQKEVFTTNPNWTVVAQRISEQPKCENFPVADVHRILDKPGELVLSVLDGREDVFAIGAMIATLKDPFEAVGDEDGKIRALRINPVKKELGLSSSYMYASREIAIITDAEQTSGVASWMGAGIHDLDKVTLASNTPRLDLSVGTEEVNEFFRALAESRKMRDIKPRVLGGLFQVARLAIDFDAPVPTAPAALEDELAQAKAYYLSAQRRAQTVMAAKDALDAIVEDIESQDTTPAPAIRYDRPFDMPWMSNVKQAQVAMNYPTRQETLGALKSYATVLSTLDSLETV